MKALTDLNHRIDSFWPTATLRAYLVAVILLATLPIATLLGYWIFIDAQGQQQRMQLNLQQAANSLAQIVERELVSSIDALAILSNLGPIQRNDIAGFERALRNRPRLRPSWTSAYLVDDGGRVLFDTATPKGRPRRSGRHAEPQAPAWSEPPQFAAQAPPVAAPFSAQQQARVSNLVRGRAPGQGAIAVEVPLMIGGKPRYRLGAWIAASVWQELLQKAGTPAGAVAGIFDREHRLIARSEAPEEFVGRQLPGALVGAMGSAASGVQRTPQEAGEASYDAWQSIALAGWGAVVGIPAEALEAERKRAIVVALATAAACLILGVLLALLMARRLTRPLQQLATKQLAQPSERIVVREVAQLRDALLAAQALEEATHARLKAKRDLLQIKADEFETLFESSPIGLAFAQDPACREVLHNAAMDALFGPPNAAGEHPVQVLYRGQRLERQRQPLQRAAADGESVQGMELELRAEGQAPKFVLVNAVPLSDDDGRPRGALSAAVDITERKQAEARLASAERKLRESQRLIDLAQEAGHVGFFHYLFEADALVWTPGLAKLLDIAPVQVESALGDFFGRIADEHRERVESALRHVYAVRQEKETLEFRVAGGTSRWLSTRIIVNYTDDGRPQEMIGVTIDISDQKEAERGRAALTQREHAARIEAEAANRAKDEFLAMLGHELRNPLSAIASAIEVLNHVDAGADTAVSARAIIARQTRHLARLMDDLLDVARVISGKILLTRQPINLAPLVDRLVATMKLTGVADRHQLNLALSEVWIDADATRIEQVANNLLTNALKYTPAGGRIDVRVGVDDHQAVLEVRDTGVGIPPTLLPRIFDLFVQAERTLDRRAGGLGIGLTLVRRLVELHGGSVVAASSASGTVFTVRLPAVEAPADAGERVCVPASRRRRVGVIEDNEDALDTLHKLLELDGHSVWCATDGISGLNSLLEQRPDVAVVDIGLPGLTGLEVAKRSRAAGYAGRMIALSGYGQESDVEKALAAGFDAYLVKPVDADELRRLLADD